MSDRPFVHLHCHSHYSLLDGASRIPELVALVKKQGMTSIALTDHGNLYGAIEFYKECKAAGLNPVIGYEAYVAPNKRTDREQRKRNSDSDDAIYHHLTLLAQNLTGFKNLIKMSSLAFLEGYHYKPRIDKELLESFNEGIICLSGCAAAEFSDYILKDRMDEAREVAEYFARLFGDRFFIEIQNNGLEIQRLCAEGAVDIANKLGLPLVATSDAHYLRQEDSVAHDVLLCLNTGRTRDNPNRFKFEGNQFHIRAPEEMYRLFQGQAEAVKRSQEIADSVHIALDFKKRHFPAFKPPTGKTPEEYLRELCDKGMIDRFGPNPPQPARDRLEHELGVICRMGFASYFLIVSDFVRFAVEHNIPAGARGSACGALVSYVLRLSHVDPLEYDLLFERFLDPNRSEAPDIDIDFCQDRRDEVIAYVKQKYGEASVAQIATFGTMAARAAIKDVGRVLNIPLERVTQLTNMVPKELGITLEDALKKSQELRQAYDSDPDVRELIDIAKTLEGTNRNVGTHAAGVVIANGPLTDFVPVHRVVRKGDDAGTKTEPVVTTQWVMGDLEAVGLLKMDFLGLRTLTLLHNCVRMIEKTRGIKVDIYRLPLDDEETFQLLQRGDAKGVFQLESDGIRELLKRMRPDNFRDIIALMALYRPGPLEGGMVDEYIDCKHGRKQPVYPHPVMQEVLSETHGVLVYQEQIMRILNRLGGIELASAYACIKAISKKKQEIIDQREAEFLTGAQARGMTQEKAAEIFGLIVKFGGYGFNKCVVSETVIIDATTGERTTVGDLFENRRPFHIHALAETGRLVSRPVTDVVRNGRKRVYRLRTRLGKTITATDNHPFRTLDGWKNLGELNEGDRIAVPRSLTIPKTESLPRHELIALAGLLSEGNTCHPTSLYFFNRDPKMIADFAEAASQFPDSVARIHTRRNGAMEVCVNTGSDSVIRDRLRQQQVNGGVALAVRSVRCGAFLWAERLGILGKKATEKAIPEIVFRLRDADVELFLGRLWAGDGHIATDHLAVPYYATSSICLAKDVQTLLLRMGIVARLREVSFKYRGGVKIGYQVHILGEDATETFLRRIAPYCLGREEAVEKLARHLGSTERGMPSKDTIPVEIRAWVADEREKTGLTWLDVERQSGVSMQDFLGTAKESKKGFRRSTLARLATFFGSRRLAEAAESDVFWDAVVSIEYVGVRDTYDLTVAEDHNFVADGIIVHNSHTTAYAQVGYQTAYLKRHFTAEFMAALLSSEIEDGNKRDIFVDHISDARKLGVEVVAPSVNWSEVEFSVKDGKIIFGLLALKGFGRNMAEAVVRAREESGRFKDVYDFCERVDLKIVNRAAMEKLIKAGALDCLQAHRAQLMAALPRAIQAASERQNDLRVGQRNLFDVAGVEETATSVAAEALIDVPPWPETEKLKYEKEVLDFYLTSHPLAQNEKELRRYATNAVAQLRTLPAGEEVTLGGMMSQVRFMNTKKARNGNSRYVRCKLEDFTGIAECVMWPDDFVRFKDAVVEDTPLIVKATIERTRDEPGLVLQRVLTLPQAAQELAKGMQILVKLKSKPSTMDALAEILQRSRGNCPVFLVVRDEYGRDCILKLGRDYGVNAHTIELETLEGLLGPGSVKLV